MPAFPPILGDSPQILILGSMPGVVSLQQQQYYAHSRNCFWWIMSKVLEFDLGIEYAERCSFLRANQIAVWDVLNDCARQGSLDQNIVRASERPNDFDSFFSAHSSLDRVLFNGAAADNIFNRHCKALRERYAKIKWLRLPSTSPAHASMTKEQKLALWRPTLQRQ